MELVEKQWNLFDFVKEQHGDRKRKYTGEPFYMHLLRVAEIVSEHSVDDMELEIALCHDLLEDTSCTKQDFALKLIELDYDLFPRSKVLKGVYDLTNQYTEEAYPNTTRNERKKLEAERMEEILAFSQTVKYAEIIDNLRSLMEHDRAFAKTYLTEIIAYIDIIDEGSHTLYIECCRIINEAMNELEMSERGINLN